MSHPNRRQWLQAAASAAATIPYVHLEATADDARRRIRVAQIGVGHAHANKLAVYRNSPDYEVVGIAEEDDALRAAATAQAA